VSARLTVLLALVPALAAAPFDVRGADVPVTRGYTIVSAKAYGGYARGRLPDGSFEPETYAFGNGGQWDIAMADKSVDDLRFEDIARTLSVSLASQNYVQARDPAKTRLLIVVYWGTTSGSAETAAFQTVYPSGNVVASGGISELNDIRNARMLGINYQADKSPARYDPLSLLAEIEANRYFVGLVAYDFQDLWRHKAKRVLWVTRFSIREHRNAFDESLPEMAAYAAQFYGQDTPGVFVKKLQEGRVDLGPLKILKTDEGR